ALEKLVIEENTSVIEAFKIVRGGLYQLFIAAVEMGDRNGGALLSGRLHENLRDVARLPRQLQQHAAPAVINNIFCNPIFTDIQAALVEILRPHPEILARVIKVFREREVQPSLPVTIEHDSDPIAA